MIKSIEHTATFLQKLIDHATGTNDKELYLMVINYIDENSDLIITELIEKEHILNLTTNN
jgi:hypothetical protein